jgi:branched-chain amino acid transport system ATP-binding protein
VNQLSYGEQRLLELLLALASKPRLLLLDEPTSGMSPAETAQTTRLMQSMPRSITLLVIEHDMDVVFSIADRITVLHHGEVFLSGAPEEIRGDERVKEIYFGGGAPLYAEA